MGDTPQNHLLHGTQDLRLSGLVSRNHFLLRAKDLCYGRGGAGVCKLHAFQQYAKSALRVFDRNAAKRNLRAAFDETRQALRIDPQKMSGPAVR